MQVKFFKSNVRFFPQFETEVNLFLAWLEKEKKVWVNTEIKTLGEDVMIFVFYEVAKND